MRKRIVIALIAVVVIGVGVYVVSQQNGNVEYHKRRYLNGHRLSRVAEWILPRVPDAWESAYRRRQRERVEFHRQALIRAGYFGYKVYVVSNCEPREAAHELPWVLSDGGITFGWHAHPLRTVQFGERAFPIVAWTNPSSVCVLALSNEMKRVDRLIERFDVPGSAKGAKVFKGVKAWSGN